MPSARLGMPMANPRLKQPRKSPQNSIQKALIETVSRQSLAVVREGTAKIERMTLRRRLSNDASKLKIRRVFSKLTAMVSSSLEAMMFRAVAKAASVLAHMSGRGG